jgi:hypothetical protein
LTLASDFRDFFRDLTLVSDFRLAHDFDVDGVSKNGRFIGRSIYWKLYFVENVLRVIINSVLSAQISPDWWEVAVGKKIKDKVEWVRGDYLANPWHTYPGKHGIYYVYLPDLGDIIRDYADLFFPVMPDIDDWVGKIEQIRLPRNVVGHMNFISTGDKTRIDSMYDECEKLVRGLQSSKKLVLKIPEV